MILADQGPALYARVSNTQPHIPCLSLSQTKDTTCSNINTPVSRSVSHISMAAGLPVSSSPVK